MLYIEDMTDVEVKDVSYMAKKTEAIVQLKEFVIFDSKKLRTISGKEVNIIAIHTKSKLPAGNLNLHGEEAEKKPMAPVDKAVRKSRVSSVRPQENPMVPEVRAVTKDMMSGVTTAPTVRAEEKPVVSGDRASRFPEDVPKETTELVKFPPVKRDLLKMMLPDLKALLPNCSLKMVTEGIEVKGPDKVVTQAKLQISEKVFNFKSRTIEGNTQRVRLLQSDKSQQQVQELFSKAGIQAVLSVRDDQLSLTAADDDQKSQASRILERRLRKREIQVEDFHKEFLQSAQWKQFIDDLERNYTVTVEKGTSSVVIDVLGDCSEEVLKQVRDKLEGNAQQSDDIHLTEEKWHLLKNYHQTEIEDVGKKSG